MTDKWEPTAAGFGKGDLQYHDMVNVGLGADGICEILNDYERRLNGPRDPNDWCDWKREHYSSDESWAEHLNGCNGHHLPAYVRAHAVAPNAHINTLEVKIADLERWKTAVIDAGVVNWTLSPENVNDPRQAIWDLIAEVNREALDPRVSEEAAALYKERDDLIRELNEHATEAREDRARIYRDLEYYKGLAEDQFARAEKLLSELNDIRAGVTALQDKNKQLTEMIQEVLAQ